MIASSDVQKGHGEHESTPPTFFLSFYRYWFRSNLSITPGSANLEILINKKNKNKKTKQHKKTTQKTHFLSCRSDYCANMKLIVIVKTNSYFLHLFL